jgi:hypothetical protein
VDPSRGYSTVESSGVAPEVIEGGLDSSEETLVGLKSIFTSADVMRLVWSCSGDILASSKLGHYDVAERRSARWSSSFGGSGGWSLM